MHMQATSCDTLLMHQRTGVLLTFTVRVGNLFTFGPLTKAAQRTDRFVEKVERELPLKTYSLSHV